MKRIATIIVATAVMVMADKYAIAVCTGIAAFGIWGRVDHAR
jgi:hypothetical protein